MIKHFRYSGRFGARLELLGISSSAVLQRAGLPGDLFKQDRILLTTEELFAIWHAVGELSKKPTIGVQIGTVARLEQFHPSCIAALSTETLGHAMSHLARYKQLTCPESMPQEFLEGEWAISFQWMLAADSEPTALLEMCFAILLSLARLGTGVALVPIRVEFVQVRKHIKALEQYFGCPIKLGATRNAIVFRADNAEHPLVTQNTELLGILAPHFEEQIRQSGDVDTFRELVRNAIQHRLTGPRPTINKIAKDLHMSSRTLQRRLHELGTNFLGVLDEARHQMARYYLTHSMLELAEAAYLLGYEDANSFIRAFRLWEGTPPGLWREEQRAKTSIN